MGQGQSFGISIKRTRFQILCCGVKTLRKFVSFDIPPVNSAINEYLYNGGYVYDQPSRINLSHVAGCAREKLRWCLIEHVCQESKV